MNIKALIFAFLAMILLPANLVRADTKTAIFAGGCFWCMEKDFEHVAGVVMAQSGYTGGHTDNPTYKTYEKGGHIEAIKITFDSDKVSYDQLLHTFWRAIDPTDAGGQFCDRGYAYSTAIFAIGEDQKNSAALSKQQLADNKILAKPIVTPIVAASKFWLAEKYHQDYYKKAPIRYKFYRSTCGRDRAITKLWGNQAHAGVVY